MTTKERYNIAQRIRRRGGKVSLKNLSDKALLKKLETWKDKPVKFDRYGKKKKQPKKREETPYQKNRRQLRQRYAYWRKKLKLEPESIKGMSNDEILERINALQDIATREPTDENSKYQMQVRILDRYIDTLYQAADMYDLEGKNSLAERLRRVIPEVQVVKSRLSEALIDADPHFSVRTFKLVIESVQSSEPITEWLETQESEEDTEFFGDFIEERLGKWLK